NLDLIVTSDTAVAHLAGALGRPVWVALKHVPDWRWMIDREDSPWYPTARLFRQTRAGDWDEVFARVAAALVRLATDSPAGAIQQQLAHPRQAPRDDFASSSEHVLRLRDRAIALHQKERLAEAERLYLDMLEVQPAHFDALHFLGIVRHQQGRDMEALELI